MQNGGHVARGATSILELRRIIALLAGLSLFLGFAGVVGAEDRATLDEPFEITADRIDYDGVRQLYVATGHVRIEQTARSLIADWVAFSTETLIGVAEGGVELIDGRDVLQAEFMVFDVDSLQGMLFEGGIDTGTQGFKIRAEEMIRTGKNRFQMRDGTFTSCRCPDGERLPWHVRARDADVELGGYGTVKNATFEVLGVPVLWIPWAVFPVKSDRETGLLFPQIEFAGRSGAGGGLPFFWAAHPQLNVTLTPRYYSERGFKGDAELEYVFGERSQGELFVSGLNDSLEEPSGATAESRWGVKWLHDQELPSEWRWQTNLNLTSDNFYSDDFNEFRRYRQFRFIESTTSLHRSFGESGGYGVMVGGRYADDVQGLEIRNISFVGDVDFVDTDDFVLQRFGEARADIQAGALVAPFGIEARLDAEAIHFQALRNHEAIFDDQGILVTANDGRFYDIGIDGSIGVPITGSSITLGEGDGIFQPGEAIGERGTRVLLHPRLARSFRLGDFAEVVPEIGWQQTLYSTDDQTFAQRGLVTARVEARNRFARDFSTGAAGKGAVVRHVLEPRLGWAYVSRRQQDRNPLFVPHGTVSQRRLRSLSLENLTRSPSDRMDAANRIVLGVGQRFYSRSRSRAPLRLMADVQTAIDWDFAEGGLGGIYLDARLLNIGPFRARVVAAFDPGAPALDEGGWDLDFVKRFNNPWVRRIRLGLGYRYRRPIPIFLQSNRGIGSLPDTDKVSQIDLRSQIQITSRVQFRTSTVFKIAAENEFIRNQGVIEYVSKCRCWAIGATVAVDRVDDVSGGLTIRFMGLGDGVNGLMDGGLGFGLNF